MTPQRIWIFLDDSNLWIEAKKAKGVDFQRKEFKEDPRLRIECGKLATVISHGREIKGTTLYGSEPPPSDSVWEKAREQDWKVILSHKSPWSGKEKMVDTKIAVDVTELVCDPQNWEEGSTVVIVSGDKDMCPCIEKAVTRNWNVEVWAMEKSLSGDLKRLDKDNDLMKVQFLSRKDLEKFTYINDKFTNYQERKEEMKKQGVVLQHCKLQGEEIIDFMDRIKKILDSFEWPWQITRLKPEDAVNILIVFCRGQGEYKDKEIPLTLFKTKLETPCVPELCKKVLPYIQYDKSGNQYTTPSSIETHNRYGSLQGVQDADDVTTPSAATDQISEIAPNFAQVSGPTNHVEDSNPADTFGRISPSEATQRDAPLDITNQQSQDAAIPGNSSDEPDEPFKPVKYKKSKESKRSQLYTDLCKNHYRCGKGRKCTYKHTEDEKLFFKKRNRCEINSKFSTYQTRICGRGKSCPTRDTCTYAHSEDEQVCCKCNLLGHATDTCPKKATDLKK